MVPSWALRVPRDDVAMTYWSLCVCVCLYLLCVALSVRAYVCACACVHRMLTDAVVYVPLESVWQQAQVLKVSAMPTFKVFKGTEEVGTQQGWSEAAVRTLLDSNGAVKGQATKKAD